MTAAINTVPRTTIQLDLRASFEEFQALDPVKYITRKVQPRNTMSSNNSTATGSSSRANSNTDLEPEVYEPLQKLPPLEAEFKTILKHPLVTTPSKGLPTPKLADEIVEIWVTQEERVSLFINYLSDLTQIGKVVLSLDCEGNNLGRDGTLSQVTLNLAAAGLTYHLDHTVLSKQLWKTQGRYGHTLKIFLEDPNIPILIYDVRGDSDGIHHHSGIVLGGVIDIQLMAIAYNAVTQGGTDMEDVFLD